VSLRVTPPATIVRSLMNGRAAVLEIPVNQHYAVLEGVGLPPELHFPVNFPRLYSVMNMARSGAHAHQPDTESEIMICVAGRATVHLWNEKGEHEVIPLVPAWVDGNEKFYALFISAGLWHTVRYNRGTVLNVVASCMYNRDYYQEEPAEYFTPEGLSLYQADFAKLA